MPLYRPPVGFHFRVEVLGLPSGENEMRFTEVGGLAAELTTEEVPEGGENRYVQRYPVRAKYPDLVCKRGLLVKSQIWDWVHGAIDNLAATPKDIDVSLLNDRHEPLVTWHVRGAWPLKWAVSDLNASANAVVVETLTFAYQSFAVDKG
ncbi:MAG TPA: phage tail protein [Burkholderiaceae bacterium]|nr:phage tail protein [Burkholderiaceae bacterium]